MLRLLQSAPEERRMAMHLAAKPQAIKLSVAKTHHRAFSIAMAELSKSPSCPKK